MFDDLLELQETVLCALPCLRVTGEIDLNNADKFRGKLDEMAGRGATQLIVDLNQVRYIDSTGLGTLLMCQRRLKTVGGQMLVICNRPHILKLFDMTGLGTIVTVFHRDADVLVPCVTRPPRLPQDKVTRPG